MPGTVRAKLVVAFVGTVVLLVVLGVLGLQVLGDSNARVGGPGRYSSCVPRPIASWKRRPGSCASCSVYGAGGDDMTIYAGGTPSSGPSGDTLAFIDGTIASTLTRFGQAADPSQLGFAPEPGEQTALEHVRGDYAQFSDVMVRIVGFDKAGQTADGLILQRDQAEPSSPREHRNADHRPGRLDPY